MTGAARTLATAAEIAAALDISIRAVNKRAASQDWHRERLPGSAGALGYSVADLPPDVLCRVLKAATPVAEQEPQQAASELWRVFEAKPASVQDEARRRLGAVQLVDRLAEAGIGRTRAIGEAATQAGESSSTVRRWLKMVEGVARSDRLPALAPAYAGRTATADCAPEAWDFWKSDFLRLSRPSAEACYERLQRTAAERRWTVPSLKTLKRRLEREISPSAITLARYGQEALKRSFPAQERDRSHFRALEAVNIDGHKFDVFVRWPDGTIGRPIMAAIQDLYSGKILGWRLGPSETADLVRLSIADVIGTWGIFEKIWLDNGRGFASKLITGGAPTRFRFKVKAEDPRGLLTQLGCEIRWTTPYSGQSKPIERAFRDLVEYIARHPACEGAYTGNTIANKPENYGTRALPIDEFRKLVAGEIAAHNARSGRRSHVCGGIRSFDAAFDASYQASPIAKATSEQRRMLLLAAEAIGADRESGIIRLFGNRYWCEDLARVAGRKVMVRFDPDNLAEPVHVYTLGGSYIASAPQIERAGFDDRSAAVEHQRRRKGFIKANKELLAAERRLTASEVAARIPTMPDAPPPETQVVRMFGNTLAALRPQPEAAPQPLDEEARNRMFAAGVEVLRARKGTS